MNYSEKLRDPRWQKKRLQIFERDNFACQSCGDKTKTLNVHHKYYIKNKDPWDYHDDILITLCEDCHEYEQGFIGDIFVDFPRILLTKYLPSELYHIMEKFRKGIVDFHELDIREILEEPKPFKYFLEQSRSELKKRMEKNNG